MADSRSFMSSIANEELPPYVTDEEYETILLNMTAVEELFDTCQDDIENLTEHSDIPEKITKV